MKLITVPLRDFAFPAPRCGSIDLHSGCGLAEALGQEIHRRVQKKRVKDDPSYRSEVPVSGFFDHGGYHFRIDGRMDGLFSHDPPKIEEIKTGFNIRDLAQRLAENLYEHPYSLQLLTYGYFYHRENLILPRLFFNLVSSRKGESLDLEIPLELSVYEDWLERRLAELVKDAVAAEKRAARRRKISLQLSFPFPEPRPGQMELMETIRQGTSSGKLILIQASTGLGKTVGVLYPILKEALGNGQRVVYVTPKNSQHSVAEDAVRRFQDEGASLRTLTVTAKGKICFKEEPLCSPEFCEFAKEYYSKVEAQGVRSLLSKKRRLKASIFRELGKRFQVCPYELQFEAAEGCDMVICDYNYVFAPRSANNRLTSAGIGQKGKPSLVIDEAHNLPVRALDYYSSEISAAVLKQMRIGLRNIPTRLRREGEALLDDCILAVSSCGKGSRNAIPIETPLERFSQLDAEIRSYLAHYLASNDEIGQNDPVLRLALYWSVFTPLLELAADEARDEFFTTFQPSPEGGSARIICCDASAMMKDCYGDYCRVVAFSATLKPFEYYVRLSGFDPRRVITAEFTSPFPRKLRKVLIIPQISTRYSRREQNYGKVADTVRRITTLKPGNYFVFLPSFDFLKRVADLFTPPDGFLALKQERGMPASEVEALLHHLRSRVTPTIVFAVQGGSFAEGLDFEGETVIGAFVVGPPLPTFDLEREGMRRYYQKKYGAGFEYAYVIPAMARAVQAAGRVIRSEGDRGLIVLMDDRFLEETYRRAMPSDWFESDVSELVSDSILKDVTEFWALTD